MRFAGLALLALAVASPAAAQQVVNRNADMSVVAPAYTRDGGPRVSIDEGHANFHTISGRYAPFAWLLRNDGYRVSALRGAITREALADTDILVIANAAPMGGADSGPAFAPEEIAAIRAWVEGGGAMLLIADHKPFAGAAAALGQAFGVHFRDAYAIVPASQGGDVFTAERGLSDHPILTAAEGDAPVTAIKTFTGSAFEAPGARPLITLGEGFVLVTEAGPMMVNGTDSAAGLLQGAALEAGRGRVVVMGEAAMFTSQLSGPQQRVMGIGAPGTEQNKQFALNMMHWLSRRRGY